MKKIMKKRIVITGMGIVSCFGNDVDVFYSSLLAGKSGIVPITDFPCEDYSTRFAGTINNFDSGDYLDKKQARRVDKFIAYAMVAGKKALESANFETKNGLANPHRYGILVSSGMGGMGVFAEGEQTRLEKGPKRVTPFLVPYIITNMAGGLLAIDTGFMGPNYSISTACATANFAIISAANHLQRGDADLMIAGGTEAAITPLGLAGFCACKALSQNNEAPTEASRPWDKNRDGFVMGEGAGIIVLETLEHALARNAPIYAEYLGGGISCDGYHMTEPRQDGLGVSTCIANALKDANIEASKVNYINAHATSTPAGDMAEIKAMKTIFSSPEKVFINATKSMIGHGLGAAGGLEAIAVIKAIEKGIIHPTINLKDPEDDALAFQIPTTAKELAIEAAISNSFGFGGHNATLVFQPFRK